jgi:hypothetical protein
LGCEKSDFLIGEKFMAIQKQNKRKEIELDPELRRLDYQLDILKSEISVIQDATMKVIEFTQTTKNWAVGIWAGSIALLLGQQADLSKYIIFTAILPLSFWFVDAHWRHIQRRMTYRQAKIREFMNDERLLISFKKKRVVDFIVYDPFGSEYRGSPDAERYSSRWRTFRYPELLWFYLPMVLVSAIAELAFLYLLK